MVYSLFRELNCPIRSDAFSVKYVVDGVETYTINGQPYQVRTGQYLLVNNRAEGKVQIGSREDVKGLCVNIKPELIAEVAGSLMRPDTPVVDMDLGMFMNSVDFPECQSYANQTRLGQYLLQMTGQILSGPGNFSPISDEQYFELTEALLTDQLPHFSAFHRIPTLRRRTRKYLLQCIWRGRDYIDTHYLDHITIQQIAREACMSEYHFFRIFKAAMECTPYQYILQKRMALARQLLVQEHMSIRDIALHVGFTDISTFSKTFRKQYGITPSSMRG